MRQIKIFIALVIVIISITATSTFAQRSGTGLGLMLGEPTGVNLKSWISESSAFDVGLAWSFTHEGSLHIHADYLYHNYNLINSDIPFYVGIGGRIKLHNTSEGGKDDARLGVRVPVGLDFFIKDIPVDIFVEIAPIVDLTPSTEVTFNGGVGFRYFFK
ncbi:MAG TPA: DUF3996 domain-containing protein [Ignavibacteria bacterium]|nr:DUF3996 domain-containing protein [Ignavibacteria bacterium]